MKILLIGKNGQLGSELNDLLPQIGEVIAVDRSMIDLRNSSAIRTLIRNIRPNCIVNAAAYTSVDQAEDEQFLASQINAVAPGVMAEEAKHLDALLIHYSTDYVFDGIKTSAYVESDPALPVNYYGFSKLQGEHNIQFIDYDYLIFRTSWLYGFHTKHSFIHKILNWRSANKVMHIASDQIGSPTSARSLAEILIAVLRQFDLADLRAAKGVYHLAGKGSTSRYFWALRILNVLLKYKNQTSNMILPVPSSYFLSKATRPMNSALDTSKFESVFDLSLPSWDISLDSVMQSVSIELI